MIFEGRCDDGKSFRHIIDQQSAISNQQSTLVELAQAFP